MVAHQRWPRASLGSKSLKADELFEAIGRGIVRELLATAPVETPSAMLPAKPHRPRKGADSQPGAVTVTPGDGIPTPGFDQVDEPPLPGFEGIPRATLREMEAAMEKITRGNQPPPGFYDPETADTSVPLS